MAVAHDDTEALLNLEEIPSEEDPNNTDEDGDDEPLRLDGDGGSEDDDEGGCDVYDRVAPPVGDEDKEKKGPCWRRAGRAVTSCVVSCCHDCKTLDKVIFVFHILLIAVGVAVATVTTLSKMSTHNQCYLKATYHSDGSMDYSNELYWCDSLLYDALVTMSLPFLFVMVNWTAQLNKNAWWMWIKLSLHVAGWLLQIVSGVMLLVAFFSWCSAMEAARADAPPHKSEENRCLSAARYFDEDKNEESTLTDLYSYTLMSLGIALLAVILWTVTLVLAIAHFCEHLYRKKDEHEDQEDDEFGVDDGESDEEGGYQYPNYEDYEQTFVRQRRVGGGYNYDIQEGEGEGVRGAEGGAVGGAEAGAAPLDQLIDIAG